MTTSYQDSPSEQLQQIHSKRDTLQRVVKITHALERLLHGLQAVLLSGQPAARISKHALRAYEKLSEKTLILPTNQLQLRLQRLDEHVLGILERILEISGIEHDLLEQYLVSPHKAVRSDDSRIDQLIDDFKRSAQTAVALRVLLRERGVFSPPLDFNVPEPVITRQITELAQREKQCRKEIENNIQEIMRSTRRIIDDKNSSDEVKSIAETILANLQHNLKHIRAGKSIEQMPMMIEMIELGDATPTASQAIPPLEPANQQMREQSVAGSGKMNVKKRKFFPRLLRYMTTPISVKWEDLD
jgi:adenylate kinase family enzyme